LKTFEFVVENQTLIDPYFNIFNTIASFFSDPTYLEILKIAFLLGGFYTFLIFIISYFGGSLSFSSPSSFKKASLFISYILGAFFLLTMSFSQDKSEVIVRTNNVETYCSIYKGEDYRRQAGITTQNAVVIGNIPYLWGWIFTTINETGRALTNFANSAFQDDQNTKLNRGNYVDYLQTASTIFQTKLSSLASSANGSKISATSGHDAATILDAIKKDCVLIPSSKSPFLSENILDATTKTGDIVRTLDGYFKKSEIRIYKNPSDITGSLIAQNIEIDKVAPSNFLVTVGAETLRCGALWANFMKDVESIQKDGICYENVYRYLTPENIAIFTGNMKNNISPAQTNNIILQAAVMNQFMEQKSNTPSEITFASGKSMAQITLHSAGTGFYMAKMLPYIQMALRAILYAFFPFVFIIMFFPYGLTVLSNYLKTLIWIELWMPISAVLNMFIMFGISEKFKQIYDNAGLNIANGVQAFSESFIMSGVAGYLFAFVPAIAWLILRGSDQMIGRITTNGLAQVASNFDSRVINEDVRNLSRASAYNEMRRQKGEELVSMAEQDMQRAGLKGKEEAGAFLAREEDIAELSKSSYGSSLDQVLTNLGKYNTYADSFSARNFLRSTPVIEGLSELSEKQALGFIDSDGNLNERQIVWAGLISGTRKNIDYQTLERIQNNFSLDQQIQAISFARSEEVGQALGLLEATKIGLQAIQADAQARGDAKLNAEIDEILSKDNFSIIRDGQELFASIGVYGQIFNSISSDTEGKGLTGYGLNATTFGDLNAIKYSFETLTNGEFLHDMFAEYDEKEKLRDEKYESILYTGKYLDPFEKDSRAYKAMQGIFTLIDLENAVMIRDQLAKTSAINMLGSEMYMQGQVSKNLLNILDKAARWNVLTDGGRRPLNSAYSIIKELQTIDQMKPFSKAFKDVVDVIGSSALAYYVAKYGKKKGTEIWKNKFLLNKINNKGSEVYQHLVGKARLTPVDKVLINSPVSKFFGSKVANGLKVVLEKAGFIGGAVFGIDVFSQTEIFNAITSDMDVEKTLTNYGFLSEDGKDRSSIQVIKDISTKGGERAVAAGKDILSEISRWVGFFPEAQDFSKDLINHSGTPDSLLKERILDRMFINMKGYNGGAPDSYKAIRNYLIEAGLVRETQNGYELTKSFKNNKFKEESKETIDVFMNPARKAEAFVIIDGALVEKSGDYGRSYAGFRRVFGQKSSSDFFDNLSSDKQIFSMAVVLFGGFRAGRLNNVKDNYNKFNKKAEDISKQEASLTESLGNWFNKEKVQEVEKHKEEYKELASKMDINNPTASFFQVIIDASPEQLKANFGNEDNIVDLNLVVDNITRLIASGQLNEREIALANEALRKISDAIPGTFINQTSFRDMKKFDDISDWSKEKGVDAIREYYRLLGITKETKDAFNIRERTDESFKSFADTAIEMRNSNRLDELKESPAKIDGIKTYVTESTVNTINNLTGSSQRSIAVYGGDDKEANELLMEGSYRIEQIKDGVYGIVGGTVVAAGKPFLNIEAKVRQLIAASEAVNKVEKNSEKAIKKVTSAYQERSKTGNDDNREVVAQRFSIRAEELTKGDYSEADKDVVLRKAIDEVFVGYEAKINEGNIKNPQNLINDMNDRLDSLYRNGTISPELYFAKKQEIIERARTITGSYVMGHQTQFKDNTETVKVLNSFFDMDTALHTEMFKKGHITQDELNKIEEENKNGKARTYNKFGGGIDKETANEIYQDPSRALLEARKQNKISEQEYVDQMGEINKNAVTPIEKFESGILIGVERGAVSLNTAYQLIGEKFNNKEITVNDAIKIIQDVEKVPEASAITIAAEHGIINKDEALGKLEDVNKNNYDFAPKDLALSYAHKNRIISSEEYKDLMEERYKDVDERYAVMKDTSGITTKEYLDAVFYNHKLDLDSSLKGITAKSVTTEDKIDFIRNHYTERGVAGAEYGIALKNGIINEEQYNKMMESKGLSGLREQSIDDMTKRSRINDMEHFNFQRKF
jgi:traG domain protein